MTTGEDQPQAQEGGNRATVALVDAKVGIVTEKVDGLRNLIETEFGNIRNDVKPLFPLVVQVALLEHADQDKERRLKILEEEAEERDRSAEAQRLKVLEEEAEDREKAAEANRREAREYRRIHLPSQLLGLLFMLVGLSGLILQLINGR